jgi:DNA repair exonuclease SbcCD nuclease subunit
VIGALVRATFDALDRVIQICIDRKVDFLVVAGDLYNAADRSLGAELAFQKRMQRLSDAGIGAFVVHGNHDPADGWTAGLDLPESVVVFSQSAVERREVIRDGRLICAVYGRSYPTRQVRENYAAHFRREPDDPVAVAVLHANVGQREGWDDYAPCSIDDLRAAGMDYWALGHIHVPGRVSDDPVAVYSGSTQGLDPSEDGPRGCFVVEIDEGGVHEEFVETAAVLWRRLEIDTSTLASLEQVRAAIIECCQSCRTGAGGRPAVVRVDLVGASQAHADLARPGVVGDLLTDVREEEVGFDQWIWIDRIRDRTRQAIDLQNVLAQDGLVGDIARRAAALKDDTEAAENLVQEILAPVLAQLVERPDLPDAPGGTIERARDRCLDLLTGGGG